MNAFSRLRQHPTGFWFVFWGELAERASFYGMRTVLALYLTHVLAFEESAAATIGQFFTAACYITPLLGGVVADRWLGRYRTILYFSLPYLCGHLILGGIQTRTAAFVAFGLLALGSGSIKPNASTLMGLVYEKEKKTELLTEAFSYYYAAINIGAALSSYFLPIIRDRHGYGVALAVPAALMAVGFIFFAAGKRYYPVEEIRTAAKTPEQRTAERQTLVRLAEVFLLIAVFWFVYDQSSTTWVYFAEKNLDLRIFGEFSFSPDQLQFVNPLLIVVLTPMFNWGWNALKRRRGGEVPDTQKMLIGFVIVIVCMAMMALAGFIAGDGKASVWWLLVATFVITLSELCISVVGLEFAFRQAAPGTKSVVTGAFLFTVFIGDTAGGFFAQLYKTYLAPGPYFAVQTGIMLAAAIAFLRVARRFESAEAREPRAA
jgi:POT family proton-dependent oligopeptide transporter